MKSTVYRRKAVTKSSKMSQNNAEHIKLSVLLTGLLGRYTQILLQVWTIMPFGKHLVPELPNMPYRTPINF
jgi:hypothetical protein